MRLTVGLAGLFLALVLAFFCFFRLLVLLSFVRLLTFGSVVGVVKRLVRHLRCGGIWLVLAQFDTLEVLLHQPEADVLDLLGSPQRGRLDGITRLAVRLGALTRHRLHFASALHLVYFLLLLEQGLLLLLEQLLFLRLGHGLSTNNLLMDALHGDLLRHRVMRTHLAVLHALGGILVARALSVRLALHAAVRLVLGSLLKHLLLLLLG